MAESHLAAFLDFVDRRLGLESISTVIEMGARDCTETKELSRRLPQASIYAFECNPATLQICRDVVAELPNATLIEKAVADHDGEITFYPIDPEHTETTWEDGNPGASSIFRASGKYPVERYVQRAVTVPSTKLSTFIETHKIARADLLWMDIQGAELMALSGLDRHIDNVRIIHTEIEFCEIYDSQPLFRDLKRWLNKHGFRLAAFTTLGVYSADAIFVNAETVRPIDRLTLMAGERWLVIMSWRTRLRHKIHSALRRMRLASS